MALIVLFVGDLQLGIHIFQIFSGVISGGAGGAAAPPEISDTPPEPRSALAPPEILLYSCPPKKNDEVTPLEMSSETHVGNDFGLRSLK